MRPSGPAIDSPDAAALEALPETAPGATGVRCDVSDRAAVGGFMNDAVARLGGLDCLGDRDCEPQRCSVTGICVDGCAVPEDCPPGQVCAGGGCTP